MIWEWMTGAVIVAIVFSLVRPGSAATTAITNIENSLAAILGKATGYS